MSKGSLVDQAGSRANRRRFVSRAGMLVAAGGVAAVTGPARLQAQESITDVDLLNLLLNLEYLKAELYTVVTTGQTIDAFGVLIDGGSGRVGTTSGGGAVPFNASDLTVKRIVQELASEERMHVSLLQNTINTLGGTYANKPAINLDGLGSNYFSSEESFLQLARLIEDLGVTAYGGVIGSLTSKASPVVARILAAEGSHAGNVRYILTRSGGTSGAALDEADVATPSNGDATGVQYFPTDNQAMTLVRTPGEVLYLALGGASLSKGGFFPLGVNVVPSLAAASALPSRRTTAALTANPNPIPLANGMAYGRTTVSWSAPTLTEYIQVRVGSPTGPLFTTNFPSGSLMTNVWVSEGMILYLQDVTNGKPLNAQNTLATLILRTFSA